MDPRDLDWDELELGAGVKLEGATTVAIGPATPVRVLRDGEQAFEAVEYAVLMVVEMPTQRPGQTVTVEFTDLFGSHPNADDAEAFLHASSVN